MIKYSLGADISQSDFFFFKLVCLNKGSARYKLCIQNVQASQVRTLWGPCYPLTEGNAYHSMSPIIQSSYFETDTYNLHCKKYAHDWKLFATSFRTFMRKLIFTLKIDVITSFFDILTQSVITPFQLGKLCFSKMQNVILTYAFWKSARNYDYQTISEAKIF